MLQCKHMCPKYREYCKRTAKLLKLWPYRATAVHKLQSCDSIISANVIFSQLKMVSFPPNWYFFSFYLNGFMNTKNRLWNTKIPFYTRDVNTYFMM